MKVKEIKRPKKTRQGHVIFNGLTPLSHEQKTIDFLLRFGFDIELVRPSSIPRSNNPDILMLGTAWEMKGPQSANDDTIKKRFRKAVKQADGRAIFDLRNIKKDAEKAADFILELFESTRGMKRLLLISKDGRLLDIAK